MIKIDKIDSEILDILKENSKLSTHKISKRTGIPITTVYNRIKKLEKEGIIKKYTIILDEKKLGKKLKAYLFMHYDISAWGKDAKKEILRENLKKSLLKLPNVEEVSYILGRFDIFIKVRIKDTDELNTIILERLRNIPGIGQTETYTVLEEVK